MARLEIRSPLVGAGAGHAAEGKRVTYIVPLALPSEHDDVDHQSITHPSPISDIHRIRSCHVPAAWIRELH